MSYETDREKLIAEIKRCKLSVPVDRNALRHLAKRLVNMEEDGGVEFLGDTDEKPVRVVRSGGGRSPSFGKWGNDDR